MNEYIILYICQDCGKEHYFNLDSLPGGKEYCEYCDICSGLLKTKTKGKIMKKVTWEEVKENLVKHNGNAKFGTVFDSVCKTIADGLNGEFGKKEEKPAMDKPR